MGKKRKRIEVYGTEPGGGTRLAMLPSGLYCNEGLRRTEKGENILLRDGWRTEEYAVGERIAVRTDTATFDFFFRLIFGGTGMTRDRLWQEWDMRLAQAGKGRNVVSRSEVWIVELL